MTAPRAPRHPRKVHWLWIKTKMATMHFPPRRTSTSTRIYGRNEAVNRDAARVLAADDGLRRRGARVVLTQPLRTSLAPAAPANQAPGDPRPGPSVLPDKLSIRGVRPPSPPLPAAINPSRVPRIHSKPPREPHRLWGRGGVLCIVMQQVYALMPRDQQRLCSRILGKGI